MNSVHKRIERKQAELTRDAFYDDFVDFQPRSFSRAYRGQGHSSYGFDSQNRGFAQQRFGAPRFPHRGERHSRGFGFHTDDFYPHNSRFESRRFDRPRFPHHGSRPMHSNDNVQRTVMTTTGHMVKCWIPKCFLTNPSTEPSTFPSRSL